MRALTKEFEILTYFLNKFREDRRGNEPNYLWITYEYFEECKNLFDPNTNDEGETYYTFEGLEVRPGWDDGEGTDFQFGF